MTIQNNFDGGYTSGMIHDRYQIIESEVNKNHYFIWDASKGDNKRNSDNSILYFNTIEDAEQYLTPTNDIAPNKRKTFIVTTIKPNINPTPIITNTTTIIKTKLRRETAFSYLIHLLTNTTQDDTTICDMVKIRYPDSKYHHSMVKFQRKNLSKSI